MTGEENIRSKRKIWGSFRLLVGSLVDYFYGPYLKYKKDSEINSIYLARYPSGELTENQILDLERYQYDTTVLETRRSFFKEQAAKGTLEETFYGSVIPLIRNIIKTDKIDQVLNIGCSYDYPDYVLSKEFKKINFVGVDFPKSIQFINEGLTSDNFQVKSGYALKMLQEGIISGNIVYFSSTANNIKNLELRLYLSEISKKTKYIVFNEPVWIFPHKEVNPSDISVTESQVGHIYYDRLSGNMGYISYNHNYKGLLEEFGYKILVYNLFKTDQFIDSIQMGRIKVVAVKE